MGRSRTDRARARHFVLLAVTPLLLTAIGVSGCSSKDSARTTVVDARDAVVVKADGTTSPARIGRTIAVGEALRTQPTGAAILSTGGRKAYLGSDSLYLVRAAGVELRRGAVVLDAREGPLASIDIGGLSVVLSKSSVVRLERAAAVRIGMLDGSAQVTAADGSHLSVSRYHQVLVVGRVLPARPTALVLTDDSAERRVVPDLVADDEALIRTALSLDTSTDGGAIVGVAARNGYVASSSAVFIPAVAGGPARAVSELALPVAIARAARGDDQAAVAKATRIALALRGEKGSWGVVARLVGTTSSGVSGAIDALLGPSIVTGPPSGPLPGQPGGGPPINLPGGGPSPSPTPPPTAEPTPNPTSSPRPTATPTPTASPGVVEQVGDIVGKLVPTPSLPALPLP